MEVLTGVLVIPHLGMLADFFYGIGAILEHEVRVPWCGNGLALYTVRCRGFYLGQHWPIGTTRCGSRSGGHDVGG